MELEKYNKLCIKRKKGKEKRFKKKGILKESEESKRVSEQAMLNMKAKQVMRDRHSKKTLSKC